MKTLIKAIVFIIMALTVVFYGGAYMLPGEARVERAVVIQAPPAKVFAIASDLRRVPDWTPWTDTDQATTFSFEGPGQGVGQVMRWASNNPMVGSGTLTITALVPGQSLSTRTDYGGFGSSSSVMRFAPVDGGTRVSWNFQQKLTGVIDRWAGLMLDGTVGAEYENGLNKLKVLAENE